MGVRITPGSCVVSVPASQSRAAAATAAVFHVWADARCLPSTTTVVLTAQFDSPSGQPRCVRQEVRLRTCVRACVRVCTCAFVGVCVAACGRGRDVPCALGPAGAVNGVPRRAASQDGRAQADVRLQPRHPVARRAVQRHAGGDDGPDRVCACDGTERDELPVCLRRPGHAAAGQVGQYVGCVRARSPRC